MKRSEDSQQSYFQAGDNMGGIQLTITTQLMQLLVQMRSIDEVFSWLAETFINRFRLHAMQIWSKQEYKNGSVSTELRTTVYHPVLSPAQALAPAQMVGPANYLLNRKQGFLFVPIERGFSTSQADFMKQYGFNYIGGCYYESTMLVSLPSSEVVSQHKGTPLVLATLLFGQEEPPSQVLPLFINILDRAMPMAARYGLLHAQPQMSAEPSTNVLTLSDLIPVYTQDEALKSRNPFSDTVVINNKEARRFYQQIDGRKTAKELIDAARLTLKEGTLVLQILLDMRLIQLYTSKGEIIEAALVRGVLQQIGQ